MRYPDNETIWVAIILGIAGLVYILVAEPFAQPITNNYDWQTDLENCLNGGSGSDPTQPEAC